VTITIYPNLFAGHDGGHFGLPKAVLDARRAYARLNAAPLDPEPDSHWAVRDTLIAAVADAFLDGASTVPSCAEVDDARRATQVHDDRNEVRHAALDILEVRVGAAIDPSEVLVKYLRPAHDQAVADLRNAWQLVDGYLGQGGNKFAMPAKVAGAASSIDGLINTYQAVRAARSSLTSPRSGYTCNLDLDDEFAVISNPQELWSRPQHNNLTGSKPPWSGLDTAGVLRFMFAHNCRVWLPTPGEQDSRFAAVYAERMTAATEQRETERVYRTNLSSF